MIDATAFLSSLAANHDCLTADEPPNPIQLASQVAAIETALITLINTGTKQDAL